MDTIKYNGWTNHDTWLANLWLTGGNQDMYQNFTNIVNQEKGRVTDTLALLKTGIKYKIITDKINLDNVNLEEIISNNQ